MRREGEGESLWRRVQMQQQAALPSFLRTAALFQAQKSERENTHSRQTLPKDSTPTAPATAIITQSLHTLYALTAVRSVEALLHKSIEVQPNQLVGS